MRPNSKRACWCSACERVRVGPGARDGGGQVLVVEAQQRVAGLEIAAGNERRRHPHDAAGYLGDQLALGTRSDRPLGGDAEPDRGNFHGRGTDGEGNRFGGAGLQLRSGRHEGQGAEDGCHDDHGGDEQCLGHEPEASRRAGCPARSIARRMVSRLRSMAASRHVAQTRPIAFAQRELELGHARDGALGFDDFVVVDQVADAPCDLGQEAARDDPGGEVAGHLHHGAHQLETGHHVLCARAVGRNLHGVAHAPACGRRCS